MTPKQAKKIADKVTAPRFGLIRENGNGIWIYERKTYKDFGRNWHAFRFRGCCMHDNYRRRKVNKFICKPNKFPWDGIMLEHELYRTDYKVSIVSETILDAMLINNS